MRGILLGSLTHERVGSQSTQNAKPSSNGNPKADSLWAASYDDEELDPDTIDARLDEDAALAQLNLLLAV